MEKHTTHTHFFNFLIFSNLFIACCAVVMCWFSFTIFHLAAPRVFMGFVFFSTLASYSIHWFLTVSVPANNTKRANWLNANRSIHLSFFIVSAIGCCIFLFLELKNLILIVPAIFLTVLYSAPKLPWHPFTKLNKHIWGKTILLSAMWTYVTAIMPLLIYHTQWSSMHWFYILNRFTLIFAICLIFDLRDREEDKTTGIKSLVTMLRQHQIRIIFMVVTILSMASAVCFVVNDAFLALILFLPAFLTYFLYRTAIKNANDYLFYFILDGLMALSAILYLLKEILTYLYN